MGHIYRILAGLRDRFWLFSRILSGLHKDFALFLPHFGWFAWCFGVFSDAFWLVCIVFLSCFRRILAGTQAHSARLRTGIDQNDPAYPPEWVRNTTKTLCCTARMGQKTPQNTTLHRQNGSKNNAKSLCCTAKMGGKQPESVPLHRQKWVNMSQNSPRGTAKMGKTPLLRSWRICPSPPLLRAQ